MRPKHTASLSMSPISKKPRGSACSGLAALALRLLKANFPGAGGDDDRRRRNDNLVLSPLSVYTALALVAAGARGAALDKLLALLGAASRGDLAEFVRGAAGRALTDCSGSGGPLVSFACGVWHHDSVALKPTFRAEAVESYKAETRAVDFKGKSEEAREEINDWVSDATKGLIPSMLPRGSVHPLSMLVLVNAIYFKGEWAKPFHERDTKVDKFHLLDGSAVDTPLMRGWGMRLMVAAHDGFKVLRLPYKAPAAAAAAPVYSMCVFLPDARDGLWSLVGEMASGGPTFLHDHLPEKKVRVRELRLPRFKTSFFSDLTAGGVLQGMGLGVTLDPEMADLSDMAKESGGGSSGVKLRVDGICHMAVIEVKEQGTEAAAVTFVGAPAPACAPPSPPLEAVDFVADHAFAFFVMEEVSGAVVFAGCVLDPSQ